MAEVQASASLANATEASPPPVVALTSSVVTKKSQSTGSTSPPALTYDSDEGVSDLDEYFEFQAAQKRARAQAARESPKPCSVAHSSSSKSSSRFKDSHTSSEANTLNSRPPKRSRDDFESEVNDLLTSVPDEFRKHLAEPKQQPTNLRRTQRVRKERQVIRSDYLDLSDSEPALKKPRGNASKGATPAACSETTLPAPAIKGKEKAAPLPPIGSLGLTPTQAYVEKRRREAAKRARQNNLASKPIRSPLKPMDTNNKADKPPRKAGRKIIIVREDPAKQKAKQIAPLRRLVKNTREREQAEAESRAKKRSVSEREEGSADVDHELQSPKRQKQGVPVAKQIIDRQESTISASSSFDNENSGVTEPIRAPSKKLTEAVNQKPAAISALTKARESFMDILNTIPAPEKTSVVLSALPAPRSPPRDLEQGEIRERSESTVGSSYSGRTTSATSTTRPSSFDSRASTLRPKSTIPLAEYTARKASERTTQSIRAGTSSENHPLGDPRAPTPSSNSADARDASPPNPQPRFWSIWGPVQENTALKPTDVQIQDEVERHERNKEKWWRDKAARDARKQAERGAAQAEKEREERRETKAWVREEVREKRKAGRD